MFYTRVARWNSDESEDGQPEQRRWVIFGSHFSMESRKS